METKDLSELLNTIPKEVTVVCATKYASPSDLPKLLNYGLNNFGENRVADFLTKYEALKDYPIVWHFIGHLQTNKAAKVLDKIAYLHSLDSIKLADMIEKKRSEKLNCFVEVSLNAEQSKNGVPVSDLFEFIKKIKDYSKINLVGLMAMTVKSASPSEKLAQFRRLKELKDQVNEKLNLNLKELSMGMSDDYQEALAAGATYLRLGRILWEMKSKTT